LIRAKKRGAAAARGLQFRVPNATEKSVNVRSAAVQQQQQQAAAAATSGSASISKQHNHHTAAAAPPKDWQKFKLSASDSRSPLKKALQTCNSVQKNTSNAS